MKILLNFVKVFFQKNQKKVIGINFYSNLEAL
jgi:hypothetical protein